MNWKRDPEESEESSAIGMNLADAFSRPPEENFAPPANPILKQQETPTSNGNIRMLYLRLGLLLRKTQRMRRLGNCALRLIFKLEKQEKLK